MKRVLIIMSTNIFSGAERVLADYLDNNKCHKFFLYTSDLAFFKVHELNRDFSHIRMFKSMDMRVVSIRKSPLYSIKTILHNLFYINKIVKQNNIEVLYGNNTVDMLYVMLYKRLFNKNILAICHVHDIIERNMYHKLIKKYESLINVFIVPSKAGKKSFSMDIKDSKKIHVIHNGCSYNKNKKSNNLSQDGKKKLIFVGQLCQRKRVDLFVDIINELNRIHPNTYMGIIVGKLLDVEKSYANKINQMIEENKGIIQYKGEVPSRELYTTHYFHADALILTSDRDPLPTVVLEAMSLGIPVFAREVDGVSEMIDNGKTGFSWSYNSLPVDIAKFIDEKFIDENCFDYIINNAQDKVTSEFNLEWKIREINKIVENL